jgi:hypothetical protein
MYTRFYNETSGGRNHLGNLDVDGRVTIKWTLKKQNVRLWTVCTWLRIGASGGLL